VKRELFRDEETVFDAVIAVDSNQVKYIQVKIENKQILIEHL